MGSHNNRSSSAGSRSSNSAKLPSDPATRRKMEQFPLVLSDATMPDDADLSLKFLALVRAFVFVHTQPFFHSPTFHEEQLN